VFDPYSTALPACHSEPSPDPGHTAPDMPGPGRRWAIGDRHAIRAASAQCGEYSPTLKIRFSAARCIAVRSSSSVLQSGFEAFRVHVQETSLGMHCLPCKSPRAPLSQRGGIRAKPWPIRSVGSALVTSLAVLQEANEHETTPRVGKRASYASY
jgi:hypothetical protein